MCSQLGEPIEVEGGSVVSSQNLPKPAVQVTYTTLAGSFYTVFVVAILPNAKVGKQSKCLEFEANTLSAGSRLKGVP